MAGAVPCPIADTGIDSVITLRQRLDFRGRQRHLPGSVATDGCCMAFPVDGQCYGLPRFCIRRAAQYQRDVMFRSTDDVVVSDGVDGKRWRLGIDR